MVDPVSCVVKMVEPPGGCNEHDWHFPPNGDTIPYLDDESEVAYETATWYCHCGAWKRVRYDKKEEDLLPTPEEVADWIEDNTEHGTITEEEALDQFSKTTLALATVGPDSPVQYSAAERLFYDNRGADVESNLGDYQFRALLDLLMASDPVPIENDEDARILGLLNQEAQVRGFGSWTVAYHKFDPDGEDDDG